MKSLLVLVFLSMALPAWADEISDEAAEPVDRDPAAITLPSQPKSYPGGADEDNLRVLASLPEAAIKIDARSLQREVYRQLYKQEMKEQHRDDVED